MTTFYNRVTDYGGPSLLFVKTMEGGVSRERRMLCDDAIKKQLINCICIRCLVVLLRNPGEELRVDFADLVNAFCLKCFQEKRFINGQGRTIFLWLEEMIQFLWAAESKFIL